MEEKLTTIEPYYEIPILLATQDQIAHLAIQMILFLIVEEAMV